MKRRNHLGFNGAKLALASSLILSAASVNTVQAQMPGSPAPNQLTMTLYPVQRGGDGQQYIITKAGYHVNVPGLGIAPDASEIAVYRNPQNSFWYVDRNGQTQPVTQQQLQWTMSQMQQQAAQQGGAQPPQGYGQAPPQYAQQPPPSGQTQQNNYSSGSSGASSALAAAGGAMAGSAIGSAMTNNNSSWGMPYGIPAYAQNGHYYYQNPNGAPTQLPENASNPYASQWQKQAQAYQQNPNAYHPTSYPQGQAQSSEYHPTSYPQGQAQSSEYHPQGQPQSGGNPNAYKGEGSQGKSASESGSEEGRRRFGRRGSESKEGESKEASSPKNGADDSEKKRRFGRGGSEEAAGQSKDEAEKGKEEGGRRRLRDR